MKKFFVTSYGEKIEIISDCVKLFPDAHKQLIKISNYYQKVDKIRKTAEKKEKNSAIAFKGFISRYNTVLSILTFFKDIGLNKNFKRHLDIGAGFGIHCAIMRGIGLVENTTALDWIDRSHFKNDIMVKKHYKKIKYWKYLEPALNTIGNSKYLADSLSYGIKKFGYPRIWTNSFQPSREIFYNTKLIEEPKIDKYLVEDIYKLKGKYDLITGFSAIYLFKTSKLLKKISEILMDGGIFIWNDPYYWFPVPPSNLIGYFPYTSQRLNTYDFKKYICTFHSKIKNHMLRVYNHIPRPAPTIKNYIDIGERYNLFPLAIKRTQFGNNFPLNLGAGPAVFNQFKNTNLTEVLKNIHQFRDDVTYEDLLTGRIIIALQKRPKNKKLNSKEIKSLMQSRANKKFKKGKLFNLGKKISDNIYKSN